MRIKGLLSCSLLLVGLAGAQSYEKRPAGPNPSQAAAAPRTPMASGEMRMRTPIAPPEMSMRAPMGKWWKNSELMQKLGVTDAQVQKIEQIFQDFRLQLFEKVHQKTSPVFYLEFCIMSDYNVQRRTEQTRSEDDA